MTACIKYESPCARSRSNIKSSKQIHVREHLNFSAALISEYSLITDMKNKRAYRMALTYQSKITMKSYWIAKSLFSIRSILELEGVDEIRRQ